MSKGVFKYGIKINAGDQTKNNVLHKTGDGYFLVLNMTLQVKTMCANYCNAVK